MPIDISIEHVEQVCEGRDDGTSGCLERAAVDSLSDDKIAAVKEAVTFGAPVFPISHQLREKYLENLYLAAKVAAVRKAGWQNPLGIVGPD